MHSLPTEWSALCLAVFLLGLRHGLDADHLAAIDGLTRLGARATGRVSRWAGVWFSLGHGAIVMAIAVGVGWLGGRWAPPAWFDTLGAAISIGFLLLIGFVNLRAVLRATPGEQVGLVGVRGRLVTGLLRLAGQAPGAAAVTGVGALFALSFDTLSQSALFGALALSYGGPQYGLVLGALFVSGMLAADGVNGWWMSTLIRRADKVAAMASRVMTAAVACVSLGIAAVGLARLSSEHVSGWWEGKELALSLSVLAFVVVSYAAAVRMGRPAAVPVHQSCPESHRFSRG